MQCPGWRFKGIYQATKDEKGQYGLGVMVKQNQPEATTHPEEIKDGFAFSQVTKTLIIPLEDIWTVHPGTVGLYHLVGLSCDTG